MSSAKGSDKAVAVTPRPWVQRHTVARAQEGVARDTRQAVASISILFSSIALVAKAASL